MAQLRNIDTTYPVLIILPFIILETLRSIKLTLKPLFCPSVVFPERGD